MALAQTTQQPGWQTLAEFALPNQPDSDRQARVQIATVVHPLNLPAIHLERLKTAVAEATLNAMEHGQRDQLDSPVVIRVWVSEKSWPGPPTGPGRTSLPQAEKPRTEAKLAGQPSPRGWGFFLIEKMMDDPRGMDNEAHHTIELFLYLEGGKP